MVRGRRPPSQTWRTFLQNHVGQIVAADFFVVPTAINRLLFVLVLLPKDAMVEVVRGQAQDQRIIQETPCDAWGYSGGFVFKQLSPGAEMTLRASAPGWSTEEKTFVPHLGTQTAVLISLKRL
jgi:hypothetical protein